MTPAQTDTLKRHAFRKGQSGNPAGNGRQWYLKRYGIEFRGKLRLTSEIAKILQISNRQVRNRLNFVRDKICPMCAGAMNQHGAAVTCTYCYSLYRSLEPSTRKSIKHLLPLTRKQKTEIRHKKREAARRCLTAAMNFMPKAAIDKSATRSAT